MSRKGRPREAPASHHDDVNTSVEWPSPWHASVPFPGIPSVPPGIPSGHGFAHGADAARTASSTFHSLSGVSAGEPMRRAPPVPATPDVMAALRERRKRRRNPGFVRKFGDYHPQDLPDDVELVRNPFTGSSVYVWNGLTFKVREDAVAAKGEFDAEVAARRSTLPAWQLLSPAKPSGYTGPRPGLPASTHPRLDADFLRHQTSLQYEPPGQRADAPPVELHVGGGPPPAATTTAAYRDMIRQMALGNVAAEVENCEARVHASAALSLQRSFGGAPTEPSSGVWGADLLPGPPGHASLPNPHTRTLHFSDLNGSL